MRHQTLPIFPNPLDDHRHQEAKIKPNTARTKKFNVLILIYLPSYLNYLLRSNSLHATKTVGKTTHFKNKSNKKKTKYLLFLFFTIYSDKMTAGSSVF